MAFTTYTRDELRDIVLDHIRARVPGANVAPGSDYWHTATAIATVVHGDQAAAQYLLQQILPATSERKYLELHAYMRGLTRLAAAPARGKVLIRAKDTKSNVALLAGSTLTHTSGMTYATTDGALTSMPSWSSKEVAPGTVRPRVIVNPNATGIAVDDTFSMDSTFHAARAVVPDTGTPIAVDLYVPHGTVPSSSTPLEPIEGAVVEVIANEAGAGGNLRPGDTLTLDAPPEDLHASAIVLEMSGGGDLETDEELRARVLDFMSERPGSGNRADYRQWARETPGVRIADAFVYPAYRGVGTVDVVPFGLPGARITGSSVNAAVAAYLRERASFQDDILVRQLTEPSTVNVTLYVVAAEGYEPDHDQSATIDGGNSNTSTIALNTAPADIEIGDRVLVPTNTIFPRLFERTVVGKLSDPDRILLDEPLPELPSNGGVLGSGGPLAQTVIDAVAAEFDAIGPGDTDPRTRFPTYLADHPAGLLRSRLEAAALAVPGVEHVKLVAPAADTYGATFTRPTIGEFQIVFVTEIP